VSTVTLTLTDNPNDPNVVDIKWDVTGDEGSTSPAKALAQHLVEHLRAIQDQNPVTDVEPKE
jgi:hypothetical protein